MADPMPGWWKGENGGLTDDECREAVMEALDEIPEAISSQLTNVAVIVEDRHPTEPNLMGIYDPIEGLQRIVIFRETNPNRDEVKKTVFHEIGHYFGADEPTVEGWGL